MIRFGDYSFEAPDGWKDRSEYIFELPGLAPNARVTTTPKTQIPPLAKMHIVVLENLEGCLSPDSFLEQKCKEFDRMKLKWRLAESGGTREKGIWSEVRLKLAQEVSQILFLKPLPGTKLWVFGNATAPSASLPSIRPRILESLESFGLFES